MNQQEWELYFWRTQIAKGTEGFLEQRLNDWADHAKHFPDLLTSKGKILEVGTGLVSVFEFSDKKCVSIDPLQDEYLSIFKKEPSIVDYRKDWEGIGEGEFDEVLCVNVIDHTPDPHALLEQIKRALKPNGKLFFQVNFDNSLSPAHYSLWDKVKTDLFFNEWDCVASEVEPRPEHNQSRYFATYICKSEKPASSSQATSSTKKSQATKKRASTKSKSTRKGKTSS